MTDQTKILAMHPDMHTLFPNKPDRWEFIDKSEDNNQVVSKNGHAVDILISASIEKLDKKMLDCFPKLKMIASISAGFSNIDLDECKARNIAVTNSPGMNSGDVADVAATMMTSLLLKMPQNRDYIMSDSWVSNAPPLRHSLRGMPIGIVGLGSIGMEVVKRLEPFGVEMKWWGPRAKENVEIPLCRIS